MGAGSRLLYARAAAALPAAMHDRPLAPDIEIARGLL
jgi:hypothetical protein